MNFYVNIDGGGSRKSGTIHHEDCTWSRPVRKSMPTEFWFGTVTIDAAQRIVRGLGAEENLHDFCIDPETLKPRLRG